MSDTLKALEYYKRRELEAMEKEDKKSFPVIIEKDSYFAKEISYQTVLLKEIIENQIKEHENYIPVHENYIPAKDSSQSYEQADTKKILKEILNQLKKLNCVVKRQEAAMVLNNDMNRKIHPSAQFKIDAERPLVEEDVPSDHGDIIAEVARLLVDYGLNYFEMNEILHYTDKILKEAVLRRTLKDKCPNTLGKDKEPE